MPTRNRPRAAPEADALKPLRSKPGGAFERGGDLTRASLVLIAQTFRVKVVELSKGRED
jgi:hypothetical protein